MLYIGSETDFKVADTKVSLFEPENRGPLPPPTVLSKKNMRSPNSKASFNKCTHKTIDGCIVTKTIDKPQSSLLDDIKQMRKTQTELGQQSKTEVDHKSVTEDTPLMPLFEAPAENPKNEPIPDLKIPKASPKKVKSKVLILLFYREE